MKSVTKKVLISVIIVVALAVIAVGTYLIADNVVASKRVNLTLIVAQEFGDKAFYDSARDGVNRLEKDKIANVKTIECKDKNFAVNLEKAAKGRDSVIMLGSDFTMINEVAAKYPETKFVWVDTDAESTLDNVKSITFSQNEGAFLAGFIAAEMSTAKKIGMVGGANGTLMRDFEVGYVQGAKYAEPDIAVQVKYVGGFTDANGAKALSDTMAENGVDVIFQAAGAAGRGVFESVKENNILAIGVDTDQKYLDPEHIICSMIKNVGDTVYGFVKSLANGEWKKGKTVYGLESGYIGIGYGDDNSTQQVSYEIKVQVDSLVEKIKSGKIVVDSAY